MIHHLSISALHPQRVAQVLAEIWEGTAAPFPAHPGSYMVLKLDEQGTMVEIYPAGTEMVPGHAREEVRFSPNGLPAFYSATHMAISVPISQQHIEQIAAREGWRCVRCDREGFFEVIELWVENRLLVELLPPTLASKYLNFMQPANLEQFLNPAADQPVVVG